MKRVSSFFLAYVLIFSLISTALAAETSGMAYPSAQTVDVDGAQIEFQCYALKDAAGNDTNYLKLRDLADILNGSAAQFEVGWDGNITITTGQAYTRNGTEQSTPFSGQRAYEKSSATTLVNGVAVDLDAIVLRDDSGGGYTYYKLRDLGAALGITVDWSAHRGIFIETGAGTNASAPATTPKVPLYSLDGRILPVPSDQVAANLAAGWFATAQTFVPEDSGTSDGLYWEYGGGRMTVTGPGTISGSWYNSYMDRVRYLYIGRNVTLKSFSFQARSSLSQVELPDTLTEIPLYAFDDCNISRIGIPSSVTKLGGYSFDTYGLSSEHSCNKNMVVYCEPGSTASQFATQCQLNQVAATQVFHPDGRTCMVSEEERGFYIADGWYDYPVTTVYAPDGQIQHISTSALADYEKVGWFADKGKVYTTMYALDGRSTEVLNSQVAANQAVGWYLFPDYICARADEVVYTNGYSDAVLYMEAAISMFGGEDFYNVLVAKRNSLCNAWRKQLNCPIAFLDYSISYNIIGVPEVNITYRNLTGATLDAFELTFTCVDAYGNVTTDYPSLYNGTFNGYSDNEDLAPYSVGYGTWTLYSNERTTKIKNLYLVRAAFSDGTIWKK